MKVCVCVFVQVSNLQRENREQINLIKKTNHEHKLELENVKKKNQVTGCGRREGGEDVVRWRSLCVHVPCVVGI